MHRASPHVNYLWDDGEASALTPAERLIYRSNLLGADSRITNTGGGNTSAKLLERDPLTAGAVEVLWVKGSGGDLRTSKLPNFASLYQSKLLSLQSLYAQSGDEDAMVDLYPHCAFNLNPRAASIDTPLHAFVPHKHVDHMHPNAVIAIAASRRSRELTREVFGAEVGWTPWLRPGFQLGLELQRRCQEDPDLQGLVLGQHGLINWADDDRGCYDLTLRLIARAADYIEARDKGARTFGGAKYAALPESVRNPLLLELLPWLRARLRTIATVDSGPSILRFVNSHDAPRLAALGTSCPDHFLRTKIRPLFVPWDPSGKLQTLQQLLDDGLDQYCRDYAAYYQRCRRPGSPAMRDPNPSVILIPGIGMLAWGRNKSESQITAEFYNCAVEVMRGAEAIDQYIALPEQEAFDIEYWQLEEAKLRRMPPEKEFSRSVISIVGSSPLASELAARLTAEGAHVVLDQPASGIVLTYGGVDHTIELGQTSIRIDGNALHLDSNTPLPARSEAVAFLLSPRSAALRDQVYKP